MSNINIDELKKIISDVEEERHKLMELNESISILKFLFNDPELITDKIDLLYGVRNIILTASKTLQDMHNNLDISLKVHQILDK
jgi:hypothetical protein